MRFAARRAIVALVQLESGMTLKEILVVDDSDPDLLYATIVLEAAGVAGKVVPFGTGAEALAFLQRPEGHDVDVILLDINMPEMNGFEFLDAYEKLHADQRAHAVVVMLTSSPDPADRARASAYGCVRGYVVKPLDTPSARGLEELIGALGKPA
jgi:CheY-like chemotaxis protein